MPKLMQGHAMHAETHAGAHAGGMEVAEEGIDDNLHGCVMV
jgi:hypothetical protein